MLAMALTHHVGALRASLLSEYGVRLGEVRSWPAREVADLVAWLPPGCALWRDVGGPASLSDESRTLQLLDYSVRVLDFHTRQGKGPKPKPPEAPAYAHERRAEQAVMDRKAAAYLRRQGRAAG